MDGGSVGVPKATVIGAAIPSKSIGSDVSPRRRLLEWTLLAITLWVEVAVIAYLISH